MRTFQSLILYDVIIISLFLIGIVCYCFSLYFDSVCLVIGICYSVFFPVAIRNTGTEFKAVRNKAMEYAVSYMIAFPVALKITEFLRDKTLSVDALAVVLTGVCIHSIYYVYRVIGSKRFPKS